MNSSGRPARRFYVPIVERAIPQTRARALPFICFVVFFLPFRTCLQLISSYCASEEIQPAAIKVTRGQTGKNALSATRFCSHSEKSALADESPVLRPIKTRSTFVLSVNEYVAPFHSKD